jgi:hypothetical protein
MAAPVAGTYKILFCTAGSSVKLSKVHAPSGVTFDGTNDDLTFNAAGDSVTLYAISTTRWLITNNVGSVAAS